MDDLKNLIQKGFYIGDVKIMSEMEIVRKICGMGAGIRADNGIKTRQPLRMARIYVPFEEMSFGRDFLDDEYYQDLMCEEMNVKYIINEKYPLDEWKEFYVPDFKKINSFYGERTKEIAKRIKEGEIEGINYGFYKKRYETDDRNSKNEGGIIVILDCEIDEKLKTEGEMRDYIRNVQNYRKELDLDITEKIKLKIPECFADFIKEIERETLSIKAEDGVIV
jgi:isoleucyl-tRNA synthetase